MTRRAVVTMLLLAATARAQTTQPAEPAEEQGLGSVAFDFLSGFASLAATPTCRGPSFGDNDTPPLLDFTIDGELIDSPETVRAMFAAELPWTKKGRPYDESACRAVRHVAQLLLYHADLSEDLGDQGVTLAIRLRPLTLVRHIDVSGNLSIFELLVGNFSPIFATDIERRLSLRPGSAVDDDPVRLRVQLDDEAQRVRDYLARRGYFDAKVDINAEADGPHEVRLKVEIQRGPAYRVGIIGVSGASALNPSDVQDVFAQKFCPFCWRERFSYDQLEKDREVLIEKLQKLGYPGVRVRLSYDPATSPDRASETVRFGVDVEERKQLTVRFEGVKEKSEEGLREALTFNTAGATDDYEAENSAEAIRSAYQGDGRFTTVVQFERTRLAPSEQCPSCQPHDEILFHVDEGPEQPIRGIRFVGNKTFPSDRLYEKVIKSRVYRAFELLKEGGFLTTVQLDQDIARLVAFYRSQGFPDVRVEAQLGNSDDSVGDLGTTAAQIAADDFGPGLYLAFAIDEGERTMVESVGFAGNHELSTPQLEGDGSAFDPVIQQSRDGAQIRAGQVYTDARLAADVERIRQLYQQRGYRYVEVKQDVQGAGAHVRVTLTIKEGLKVHAGKVVVRGNFKTARWVVTDMLGVGEGDVLTPEAIDTGQAGLRGTALFSAVRTDFTGLDPVNLVVGVAERFDRTADIDAFAGYSTDISAFISGTLYMQNIGGIGVGFTATGELGLLRKRLQGSLVFPLWVMRRGLGLPLKLELQARYRADDTPRFGLLTTLGGTATLSRQLAPGVLFSFKYDWNRFGRSTELLRPAGNDQNTSTTPIETTTALLGPAVLVDERRPNALNPSSGYVVAASVGWASTVLGGTDDFIKVGLSGQLFLPLGKRVVVTNTVRFDEGFPLGGAVLLPEVERFTAGGDTTVRGYETDRLATEVIRDPLAPAGSVSGFRAVPAGGNIRIIHRFDFQLRVWDAIGFASGLFLDSGTITNSLAGFGWDRIRQAIGVAFLRWISSAGVISVEYAVPLQPKLGDDPTGRFHLNFGFAF
jgi:outer membrane protein insertion porin family